ncbi:MAG TPA: PilN domain-containing protein [Syntrophales bacterium]|nr:PilN domain-containing protein [Syntrophales bacterium]
MIRINLLPYREREKKEGVTRQIVIIVISSVVFLLAIGSFQLYLVISTSNLERDVKIQEEELARLKKTIVDIEQYKLNMATLQKKLAIINALEENRLAPVKMLDELSLVVPVKEVWLDKISEKGTEITMEGMARNNIAVAHFMKNLSVANFVKAVDLISTREKEIAGIKLQQFVITCVKKKVQ